VPRRAGGRHRAWRKQRNEAPQRVAGGPAVALTGLATISSLSASVLPWLPDGSPLWAVLPPIARDTPARPVRCRAAVASTLIAGLEQARDGALVLDQAADWMPIPVTRHAHAGRARSCVRAVSTASASVLISCAAARCRWRKIQRRIYRSRKSGGNQSAGGARISPFRGSHPMAT
jgi:hypothetical protein